MCSSLNSESRSVRGGIVAAVLGASIFGGLEASAAFIEIHEIKFKTTVGDPLPEGSPFIDTQSSPLADTIYHSSGTAMGDGDFEFYSAARYQNESGKRTFSAWLQTLDQFTSGAGLVDAEITIEGRFTNTADNIRYGFTSIGPETSGIEYGSGRASVFIDGFENPLGTSGASFATNVAGKTFRFRFEFFGYNSATTPGAELPDLPTGWGFIEKIDGDSGPVPGPGALAVVLGLQGLARRRRR